MKQARILTPLEKNHLLKYGSREIIDNIIDYGEMPVEYITGLAEFRNLTLYVNQNVLIPRVETELLVDICLEKIDKANSPKTTIAELGTGSGAIGFSLLDSLVNGNWQGQIIMSDVSKGALEVTKKNFRKISKDRGWPESIKKQVVFLESDLFSNYPNNVSFDLIVANLPYIPSNRLKDLDNSVKDFEPMLALDGGIDGDQIIRRLLKQAKEKMKTNGVLLLEIDDRSNVLAWPDDYEYDIIKDQFKKQRFIKAFLK